MRSRRQPVHRTGDRPRDETARASPGLAGGPLPVPDTLGGLVGERLRELPAPVAERAEAVAIMPGAPLEPLSGRRSAGGRPGRRGYRGGGGGRQRTAALLPSTAGVGGPGRDPTCPAPRASRLAANTATDLEQKARHSALAAGTPSAQIAAELDDAARAAELRGAPATAAELLELAASLTPGTDLADRHRRLLTAGRLLHSRERPAPRRPF